MSFKRKDMFILMGLCTFLGFMMCALVCTLAYQYKTTKIIEQEELK